MPKRKTHEQFCTEVRELTGDEYVVMTDYVATANKLTMRHNVNDCGNEWLIRPADFLKGTRCPKCFKKSRKQKTENEQTIES
jgi:hypothetical protein